MNIENVLEKVVDAHGGEKLWNTLQAVEATVSAKGLLFPFKWRFPLNRYRMRAFTREPRFQIREFPRPGQTAELLGADDVRISDQAGNVVDKRHNPRRAFKELRRLFWWDDMDFTYFAGYATWGYLVTPFLLLRDDLQVELLADWHEGYETLKRIRVLFPDSIPAHCRQQDFYFDHDFLLRRIDYTAEVVGDWATAAHYCFKYKSFSGLMVPTRRYVRPRMATNHARSFPTLVDLTIHDLQLVRTPRD